eukprot:6368026-Ditylum_brightwellii.AAC.1
MKNLMVCHRIWGAGATAVSEEDSTRIHPTPSPQHFSGRNRLLENSLLESLQCDWEMINKVFCTALL